MNWTINIYEIRDESSIYWVTRLNLRSKLFSMSFHPTKKIIAVQCERESVKLYSFDFYGSVPKCIGHLEGFSELFFSKTELHDKLPMIVSGGLSGVRLWNINLAFPLETFLLARNLLQERNIPVDLIREVLMKICENCDVCKFNKYLKKYIKN